MATSNPEGGSEKDNFELELMRVRENVESTFLELSNSLEVRENELLSQLDRIQKSYHSYRNEYIKFTQERKDLGEMKVYHEQHMQTSSVKKVSENLLKEIHRQLNLIKVPTQPQMVRFVCDNKRMLSEIKKLGELAKNIRVDYKSKTRPVLSICEYGNRKEQLNYPQGVVIDNTTGKIYVADSGNKCVKVFDSNAKYLSCFGHEGGAGKMEYPFGLAIYGNKILISHGYHSQIDVTSEMCILSYQLNGKYISKFGSQGLGNLEFNVLLGITVDQTNGDIYACDNNNHRIQVISKSFQFISEFGKGLLKGPRDIKLSKEFIYVLDESNPCVLIFDYNHVFQNRVGSKAGSFFISIDYDNNLLISSRLTSSILIYNHLSELIGKVATSQWPLGTTVDSQGRLIVMCGGDENRLEIY